MPKVHAAVEALEALLLSYIATWN